MCVCVFVVTELWDHPDVTEFFNFDNLDIGKTYAERAHAANAGNGVGHGLRYSCNIYTYILYTYVQICVSCVVLVYSVYDACIICVLLLWLVGNNMAVHDGSSSNSSRN